MNEKKEGMLAKRINYFFNHFNKSKFQAQAGLY